MSIRSYIIIKDMKFSINRWSQLAGLSRINEAEGKDAKLKASIEGLAVGAFKDRGEITLVLYDPKAMKTAVEEISNRGGDKASTGTMSSAIMGMIRIAPPAYGQTGDESSCRGAWEVIRSGVRSKGTGVGGLLYRLAAAASPTGKIMPDRREVSSDAEVFWKSKFSKMPGDKRERNALDDESNARTEDPKDDCLVHDYDKNVGPGSNPLNYVFDDLGQGVDVSSLNKAHEDFMDEISWSLPSEVNIDQLFFKASSDAFQEMK